MKCTYYGFYGKDAIGIYTNAHNMLKIASGIQGFNFEKFSDIETAKKYIQNGYNSTRFIHGKIENLERLMLNTIYSSAECCAMGWITTSIWRR